MVDEPRRRHRPRNHHGSGVVGHDDEVGVSDGLAQEAQRRRMSDVGLIRRRAAGGTPRRLRAGTPGRTASKSQRTSRRRTRGALGGYLEGQLRLSCPRYPHTLQVPALADTSQDLRSCPCSPQIEHVLVPLALTGAPIFARCARDMSIDRTVTRSRHGLAYGTRVTFSRPAAGPDRSARDIGSTVPDDLWFAGALLPVFLWPEATTCCSACRQSQLQ
ncbi:hypothetical protein BDK89_0135 [Ilumatobacter fluminis]|uniref:Uncharacterized protein n=1 Tax=Ilumatobacter fluminis TaxID=467091 RepID=A0A4R7HUQ0_9ACTN|nr:hypothetical protein BDK89_0135 [Ilumatobacter fluminis]